MVNEEQDRSRKLEQEFARIGLPSGRHGDVRERAELVGANTRTMRAWLSGTRPPPDILLVAIRAIGNLSPEARIEHQRWARECADRGDYLPYD